MPKLFWKARNDEVLQLSGPSTRNESPSQNIFHVQSETTNPLGGGTKIIRNIDFTSKDHLLVETYSKNLHRSESSDDSLNSFGAQINGHSFREGREIERSNKGIQQDFGTFEFRDEFLNDEVILKNGFSGNKNGLINVSNSLTNGTRFLTSSIRDIRDIHQDYSQVNGLEVDIEDDISKMAAQRDQQRGNTRFIRGMMAPITSKDDENRKLNSSRRLGMLKHRSESGLDMHEDHISEPTLESRNSYPDSIGPSRLSNIGESVAIRRFRSFGEGKGPQKRTPSDNFLEDIGSRDIMAQSIRRQTLKGSKSIPLDNGLDSEELYPKFRVKPTNIGTQSPNDFTILRPEREEYSISDRERESRNTPHSTEFPFSHDDVQILNLQGFMDSTLNAAAAKSDAKRKSRRRQLRRLEDDSPVDLSRGGAKHTRDKARKRKGRHSLRNQASEGDDDVVLKDIDDMDEKMASLVIGPKLSFQKSAGRAITFEEAVQLRQILTGNPVVPLPKEWLNQSFIPNKNPIISYGLLQKKGGPCGVLACVQAHMMKCLIFGSRLSPTTSIASPLRPSTREWSWALSVALTEMLWRINDTKQNVILALPGVSFSDFTDFGLGRYTPDGLTETITLHDFNSEGTLLTAVEDHLQVFTSESSSGCVLFLYSALLTRGLERVSVDMDAGGGYLMNSHGYASQEVVNLLLTGEATTNTFDGEHTFEDTGTHSIKETAPQSVIGSNNNSDPVQHAVRRNSEVGNKMVLRGVQKRSEIGLLSLFEHYGSCKVGSHLKNPEYPMWVVCSESHYSVVFARDQFIAREEAPTHPFDVYFYDGLALQEDEIRLTIDLRKESTDTDLVPPLDHCLRTKWPKASISWNGTDPIL